MNSPCTLIGSGASASCSVTYTPSGSPPRTDVITGNYNGDSIHTGNNGPFSLGVGQIVGASSLTVSCTPSAVTIGQTLACTASVSSADLAQTPAGTVTFQPTGSCTLVGAGGSSQCSVSIIPNMAGALTIVADYSGDTNHQGSSGSTTVTVSKRSTSTVVSCSPANIAPSQASICTATVIDVSEGSRTAPTGVVIFTGSVFSCTLTSNSDGFSSHCSLAYLPGSVHLTLTVTANYSGDSLHAGSTGDANIIFNQSITTTTVTVACAPSTVTIGNTSACTITITGSSPSGTVIMSTSSVDGGSLSLVSSCTLSYGSCTVSGRGLSAGTVLISAIYSGDTANNGNIGSERLTVQRAANTAASNSVLATTIGGKVSSDQTSVTGVSVSITGSTAVDGTSVTLITQHLNGLSVGVGLISLNNAAYYDVLVSGVTNGNAAVCIADQSASSMTTMMYWDGNVWVTASSVSVSGSQVCGTIPVSALTGTSVAVGDVTPPFFSSTVLLIIGVIVVGVVAATVLVFSRRKKSITNP